MSPFWHLEFRGHPKIFVKFVHPCSKHTKITLEYWTTTHHKNIIMACFIIFLCCIFDDINISRVMSNGLMNDDRMRIWPQFDRALVCHLLESQRKTTRKHLHCRALALCFKNPSRSSRNPTTGYTNLLQYQ
jgi:hypothetical protein